MKIHENKLRDIMFEKYKHDFFEKIIDKQESPHIELEDIYEFPSLIKKQTIEKINGLIDDLEDFEFIGKEVRLKKENTSTTRIDLLGLTLNKGPVLLELKKSNKR